MIMCVYDLWCVCVCVFFFVCLFFVVFFFRWGGFNVYVALICVCVCNMYVWLVVQRLPSIQEVLGLNPLGGSNLCSFSGKDYKMRS